MSTTTASDNNWRTVGARQARSTTSTHYTADGTIRPPRDSSRDSSRPPSRDSSRGPSRDSSQGPSRDSSRGPSRDSSQGPSRDSSRGPSRDSSRGPSRDGFRESKYSFEVIRNFVLRRDYKEGGNGLAFKTEYVRGFPSFDLAVEFALRNQSRLDDDSTLYIVTSQRERLHYITRSYHGAMGTNLPNKPIAAR